MSPFKYLELYNTSLNIDICSEIQRPGAEVPCSIRGRNFWFKTLKTILMRALPLVPLSHLATPPSGPSRLTSRLWRVVFPSLPSLWSGLSLSLWCALLARPGPELPRLHRWQAPGHLRWAHLAFTSTVWRSYSSLTLSSIVIEKI